MALEDLILKSKNLVLKDNLMCENNYINKQSCINIFVLIYYIFSIHFLKAFTHKLK